VAMRRLHGPCAVGCEGHLLPDREARFHTKSGLLTAVRSGEWIELDFPALSQAEIPVPDGLEEALGTRCDYVGKSRFALLVEIPSEQAVREVIADFTALKKLDTVGVIVTSRADSDAYDFVSRFFAPALGVEEDPVTGSAHCALGPYWSARLGKTKMTGYQASIRGGTVRVEVRGDRVGLAGKAFTVLRGELS
jgi:PhzF family phenazine biosynthesis protein